MNILCVSNCNILGIKCTLEAIFPDATIEDYLIQKFLRESKGIQKKINDFDLIISTKKISNEIKKWTSKPDFIEINPIIFHAFHPDQCYLFLGDTHIGGLLGDYHSLSTFLGFKKGLSIEQTEKLINNIYKNPQLIKLGWNRSIQNLQSAHSDIFDSLIPILKTMCIREPFMYTLNHPKINILSLMVQLKLMNAGLISKISNDLQIFDSLSKSVVWSVEKEVAEYFKFVSYSEAYKESESNNFFNRLVMIEKSFKVYSDFEFDINDLVIRGNLISKETSAIINNYESI